MRSKKGKTKGILEGIRKPTAPGGKRLGPERPEAKVHPVGRGTKHKKKLTKDPDDGDV